MRQLYQGAFSVSNNELINDKGLFLGQSDFNFSLPDSFETIANFLRTIKEYREYAHPDSPDWQEYMLEFFHILGFHTEQKAPRLLSLGNIDDGGTSKALVLLLSPSENPDEIIPGLDWLSYLFYAANYHHAHWGFLTNGFEMRVFDFRRNDYRKVFLWANLDGIIRDEKLDTFFTVYKIFAYMRGPQTENRKPGRKVRKEPALKLSKSLRPSEYDYSYHTNNIPQPMLNLFQELRQKILSLSPSVTEKFTKKYIGYAQNKYFCSVWIQKTRVKIWVDVTIDQISDPNNLCRDVRGIGHYGSGDIEINLENTRDVDAVFEIIKQAHKKKG